VELRNEMGGCWGRCLGVIMRDEISYSTAGDYEVAPWRLLALTDEELEKIDVVMLHISICSHLPCMRGIDYRRYRDIVDQWTTRFREELPAMEAHFARTPERWKSDIRFFRVGMLQGFLGHHIGIRYIEDQKSVSSVKYADPLQLFLTGLIDTRRGTCGNMAALHVAIGRRMGWPVSLACARSHLLSRFDDGEVVHNIEATSTHPGSFASDPDDVYIERFRLPSRAIKSGSDLRSLSAREMLGVFISLRARYYRDTESFDLADRDYAFARVLFPNYRAAYIDSMVPMLLRGQLLFEPDEIGHPDSLLAGNGPRLADGLHVVHIPAMAAHSDV
jgi:hypothetical protein